MGFFHQWEAVELEARYQRNIGTLTVEEFEKLRSQTVCVVGCGGLGGYVIEMLARLGVGRLIAVDGDVFEESNLNRQLLSEVSKLGAWKAQAAVERVNKINPDVEITAIAQRLTAENGVEIIDNADVVVDALDSIESRLVLESLCENLGIPLVHGAIGGWYGQVSTVMPGDGTLSFLYRNSTGKGIEKALGNPSFTPALVAAVEISEVVKLLAGKGEILSKKLLMIDTLEQSYEVMELHGLSCESK